MFIYTTIMSSLLSGSICTELDFVMSLNMISKQNFTLYSCIFSKYNFHFHIWNYSIIKYYAWVIVNQVGRLCQLQGFLVLACIVCHFIPFVTQWLIHWQKQVLFVNRPITSLCWRLQSYTKQHSRLKYSAPSHVQ